MCYTSTGRHPPAASLILLMHGGIKQSMERIRMLAIQAMHDSIFRLLLVLVLADLVFGGFRAIREKRFNSTTGIDGVIRKSAMLVAMVFFHNDFYLCSLDS